MVAFRHRVNWVFLLTQHDLLILEQKWYWYGLKTLLKCLTMGFE